MNKIDLVIPWVDGNDPKWQEDKNKYTKFKNLNSGYYQDWGWMRYWFRCVEKNLPWINNIFFVTYGHVPSWLNLNNPKLKIINHKDYIPPEFLPTFGSISFIFNLHKIKELSETFIYAEDDIFFVGKQEPEDFFSNEGLVKDYLWLKPITEQFQGDFSHLMLNDILFIKKYFNMQSILNKSKELLYSKNYPEKIIKDNQKYQCLEYIPGFKESHMAYSFLKSTINELWIKEPIELYKCCLHKFRSVDSVCSMLIRDWQLVSGKFVPFYQEGRFFTNTYDPKLEELILDKNTKMICINESEEKSFSENRAKEICSYFEKRFPEHSSFEKD